MRLFRECIEQHYNSHWSKLHFHKLQHEKRTALTFHLSTRPFRTVSICWHKRKIHEDDRDHGLDEKSRLHHYSIRYLLERLSWLARDHQKRNQDKTVQLVFSQCKNLSYKAVDEYIRRLKGQDTEIDWPYLDHENYVVRSNSELLGLKAADCVASGMRFGLDLNPQQLCIDAHCRQFKRITYAHKGKKRQYGLKIMPEIPDPEPQRDDRYAWIKEYK